ncbi:MAG: sulfatase, partial [Bacteroidota bacterium]
MKRIFLIVSGILLSFVASRCISESTTNQEKIPTDGLLPPPNIIWLVAEDLSPRLAPYGDFLAHTPNINRLAENGIVFENAYAVSGVCAPSRSAMITGMYPTSIGTQHMRQKPSVIPMPGFPRYNAVPPPEVKAFPELLRAAGYWTASYRKLDYQFGEPFTVWDSVSDHPSWRERSEAARDRPFFIYYTFEITHEINIWPDTTKIRFYKEFNIEEKNLAPDVAGRPKFDEAYAVDPQNVAVPPYLPDTKLSRDHIARLYNNVSRMDTQIGRVLDQLEADGLRENTIIFFMSDHGDCLPRAKRWIYDSGIKAPLIIHIPLQYLPSQVEQPSRDEHLYSFVDLAPTVLSLAGVTIPDWIQGRAIFTELQAAPRQYVHAGRDRMDNRYDTRRAVRDEQYKYIRNYNPEVFYSQPITFLNQMPLMQEIFRLEQQGKLSKDQSYWLYHPKNTEEELYDIIHDPHELNNLAADTADYREILQRMRNQLVDWQSTYGDLYDVEEIDQAERMWPGGVQPTTETPTLTIEG